MSHGAVKSAKNGSSSQAAESSREGSESLPPPPDGGWGWMVVFASFMIHIVTDGMTYSFGVFYAEFLTYFDEGKGKTAWIVSILVGVTLSSGPVSSSFVNRWGCRAVTVAGAVLSAACVVLSAFANNVTTLIFTIGIGAGVGFGLIYLPAIVSVTVWFDRYRSLATGIAVCGSGLGTFLFAPITKALITNYGWRGAMALIGAFILNCIPLGLMFKPVPERPRTPVSEPMLPKSNKSPLKKSQSTEHITKANGKLEDDVARLTLSQPALNKPHEQRNMSSHSRHGSGIMQRPDVLYQGSMTSLAKFRSTSPERVQISIKRKEREQRCGWLPCSEESKAALAEMLDLSLLIDPIFILFSVSNFLTSIGFYIPYVYTVPMSEKLGVENSAYLISIIGASNLVGRIVLGYISDKPWVDRLLAYNVCLTIAGIGTAMAMVCWEFWGLALYCTVFGFTIGAYVGLTSVVLVDLLGIEKLTNAFGLLLLFQGIASLIGPPFAGPVSSSFVNRWGCRAVTVAGAVLSAACVVLSAFANNVTTLIFTIGIGAGVGFGLIYLPAIVSVTVWFDRYRSLATGIAVCGSGLGTFLFAPITKALITNYGWRGAMALIGAFILNCIPLGLMFKPVPERPRTPVSEPMLPKSNKSPLKKSQSTEHITKANGKLEDDVARLTLSQPALNKPHEQRNMSSHSRHGSGIMQRPDVLYQGSMTSLAKFRSTSPERVQISIKRKEREQRCGWLPCSEESKAALAEMLDLSLLIDPIFILFSVSNFLTSIGFYIPYVYTVPMSEKLGVENSAYLISIIGASNLVGRIVLGYISDKPWVDRLLAYNVCLTIAGIGTAMAMVCWEFWGLALYCTVFGFTIGAYVGLTSVVLVDLLGIEKLTNAFGLLLLFQGIASLIGPPFAGWLYDTLNSYAPGFYVAGGTISVSGLILFFIPMLQRRMSNREAMLEQI